jgi:hypothetical protein
VKAADGANATAHDAYKETNEIRASFILVERGYLMVTGYGKCVW